MKSQQRPSTVMPDSIKEKFMGWMIIGWLLAGVIGIILSWAFGDSLISGSLGWIISGAIGGLLTGYALTLLRASIQGKLIILPRSWLGNYSRLL